jgi:acyl-CoA synthetase (AMP-forming)/AMP-acid ligase II
VTTYLDIAAAEFPEKTAIVDPRGARISFAELKDTVDRMASGFRESGLAKGDVVAVQLPNWLETCIAHLALVRCGMVTLFLAPPQRGSDLRYILERSTPKMFVIPAEHRTGRHVEMYDEMRAALGNPLGIVVGSGGGELPDGMTSWEQFLEGREPDGRDEPVELGDPQFMVFSSGTTADPKGVLHSYGTGDYHIHVWRQLLGFGHEDVVFTPATLGHVAGSQFGLRLATLLGAKLVLMDRWDAAEAIETIEREGVTYSFVTPTFLEDMLASPALRKEAFRTFRIWTIGGSRIRPTLVTEFEERAGGKVLRGFGMTEHMMSGLCRAYDPLEKRTQTDGRALPGCRYRIVDPEDCSRELPAGSVGELVYRGPALVDGYFTSEEETTKTFVDGWQLSGDLAVLDEDGFMTIVDRKKDMIIRGGENISPLEIENVLARHERVAEVTVVRYPDQRLGERVCAVVVPAAGATVTLDELTAYLAENEVARYKHPERLELRDELPRSNIGKVLKRVLEQEFEQEAQGA